MISSLASTGRYRQDLSGGGPGSFRFNQWSGALHILARPAVEVGGRLGFLPGDLAQKVINPYFRPFYDALSDMAGPELGPDRQGIVEIVPLVFMRGRTLSKRLYHS